MSAASLPDWAPGPVGAALSTVTVLALVASLAGALRPLLAGRPAPPRRSPAAALAAAGAAVGAWLTAGTLWGVPPWQLDARALVTATGTPSVEGALAAGLLAALAAPAAAARYRTVLLAAALVVPSAAGHAGGTHALLLPALAVHVLAASGWCAGLAAALDAVLRGPADEARTVVTRFSQAAGRLAPVTVASGAAVGLAHLAGGPAGPEWAGLLVAKAAAATALLALGALHRARTLPRLSAGDRRRFVATAAVEALVMAATLSLAGLLASAPVGAAPGWAALAASAATVAAASAALLTGVPAAGRPTLVAAGGLGLAVLAGPPVPWAGAGPAAGMVAHMAAGTLLPALLVGGRAANAGGRQAVGAALPWVAGHLSVLWGGALAAAVTGSHVVHVMAALAAAATGTATARRLGPTGHLALAWTHGVITAVAVVVPWTPGGGPGDLWRVALLVSLIAVDLPAHRCLRRRVGPGTPGRRVPAQRGVTRATPLPAGPEW